MLYPALVSTEYCYGLVVLNQVMMLHTAIKQCHESILVVHVICSFSRCCQLHLAIYLKNAVT